MKKIISISVALIMLFGMFSISAFAEGTEATAKVYVTISDGTGKLVLTQEEITVTDKNNDGTLTIDEALFATHEAKYEGGAAAGYGSVVSSWGLSLTKLWGVENGGSYGYYVNNASAIGLGDEVKEGDYINAFIYTDTTSWSDKYTLFDKNTATVIAEEEITLTLSAAGYDASYNPITVPVQNATITLNGESTEYKTDEDGKVTLKLPHSGTYVISAVSSTDTLVPPVLTLTVEEKEDVTDTDTDETITENDGLIQIGTEEIEDTLIIEDALSIEDTSVEKDTSPKTGDNSNPIVYALLLVLSTVGVVFCVVRLKKKFNEK